MPEIPSLATGARVGARSRRVRASQQWPAGGVLALAMAAAAGIAGVLGGCIDAAAPVPQPLPANIEITARPTYGSTVPAADGDSIVLEFDRRMDPESVLLVRRVSFLLPLSVDRLEGYWNQENTRFVLRLASFPVQLGAGYEVVFAGLRTADGELYNRGSFKVLYRTRGAPDLLPLVPPSRFESRDFCVREGPSGTTCVRTRVLKAASSGRDSLTLEWRAKDGSQPLRRDYFRRDLDRIEWLGFEIGDPGEPERVVRWADPPPLLAVPVQGHVAVESLPQTGSDGTRLVRWRSADVRRESPQYVLAPLGRPIQIVFSDCHLLEIDYALRARDGNTETHRERWWLHPGVGIVRRELHIEWSDGRPSLDEIEIYSPGLSLLED